VHSDASTVEEYLAALPTARLDDMAELVHLIRANLQPGFDEEMRWGMISWEVPLTLSGPTYNGQPLGYVALASQKNHISVYLLGVYSDPRASAEFERRWAASGKRLDMGKSCVRFASNAKADLDTIAWAVGLNTPSEYLELVRAHTKSR
jgi:hypothetical protein